MWQPCKLTGKNLPLYTADWDPELYAIGLHTLDVKAKDATGAESLTRVEFSLDNTRSSFPILARIALMMDITTVVNLLMHVNFCSAIYSIFFSVPSALFCISNGMRSTVLCYKILPNENPP